MAIVWGFLGQTITSGGEAITLRQRCFNVEVKPTSCVYDTTAGSIPSEPSISGMTNFGTNAKYVNNVLIGSTRLNLRDGQFVFDFDSTAYDWLVVTNGNLAKLHGSGSVNGIGGYTFEQTALDDSPDTIRIQIWDSTNTLVYDINTSVLSNGNIEVHN